MDGLGHEQVEGLGLVDEGAAVGSEVDDGALLQLPGGLVHRLGVGVQVQVLHRPLRSDDRLLHLGRKGRPRGEDVVGHKGVKGSELQREQ